MRAWTWQHPGERPERRYFQPDIPKPQPVPTPPTDNTAQLEAEAKARREAKNRRGRSANILTSPSGAKLGQTDTAQSPTMQRTLGVK